MAEARVERRLAAVLAADSAGESGRMGVAAECRRATPLARRCKFMDPKIWEHRGRIANQ
jgi:adenylate cyclase